MIRWAGIIFIILLLGVAPIVAADYYIHSGFLDKFMKEQSMSIMGTILAIYIAAASSFLAILMTYEQSKGRAIFTSTSADLKRTTIFVITLFAIHLLLLVATPKAITDSSLIDLGLKSAKVFTLYLYIFALYELSHVMFSIREVINNEGKT